MDPLRLVGNVVASLATLSAWWFVIDYSRDRWRDYELGRYLMRFTQGLAVILTYLAVVLWFPDVPETLRGLTRIAVFGYLAVMLSRQWLLLRRKRAERDARHLQSVPYPEETP